MGEQEFETKVDAVDDEIDGCELDFSQGRLTGDNEIDSLLQQDVERKEEDAIRPGDGPETS